MFRMRAFLSPSLTFIKYEYDETSIIEKFYVENTISFRDVQGQSS